MCDGCKMRHARYGLHFVRSDTGEQHGPDVFLCNDCRHAFRAYKRRRDAKDQSDEGGHF